MPFDYLDPSFGNPSQMGGTDPLDLTAFTQPVSGVMGGPPPMASQGASQMPAPQQGGKRGDKSALIQAALAALLPIAAKRGGRVAVAALLQGVQQAQARNEQTTNQQTQQDFQNQRLTAGDQRLAANDAANEQYRQQQLTGQQEQQRSALMKEATTAIQQADSPETVNALLQFYNPRLQSLGVRDPGALNRLAQQVATPTALEQKAAQKYITQLEKTYGQDWAQKVGSATFVLPGAPVDPATNKPRAITVQELLSKSGMTMSGVPMKPPTTGQPPAVGSFEDYVIRKYGETPTPPQIEAARKAYMQADDKPTAPASADGLTPRQQQQVAAQARTYEGLPAVKNTQIMSEAVNFANSLDANTKNPADDQALIYAFAKAMDPNSVVREGEYATVQKYAQSWAESFGFNAARIFSNSTFLTPEARSNMKRTIQQRFNAARGQYKAARDSYVKKINKITGQMDGEDWLTDYGAAFPSDPNAAPAPTGRATVAPPASAPVRAGGAGPAGGVPNPFRR